MSVARCSLVTPRSPSGSSFRCASQSHAPGGGLCALLREELRDYVGDTGSSAPAPSGPGELAVPLRLRSEAGGAGLYQHGRHLRHGRRDHDHGGHGLDPAAGRCRGALRGGAADRHSAGAVHRPPAPEPCATVPGCLRAQTISAPRPASRSKRAMTGAFAGRRSDRREPARAQPRPDPRPRPRRRRPSRSWPSPRGRPPGAEASASASAKSGAPSRCDEDGDRRHDVVRACLIRSITFRAGTLAPRHAETVCGLPYGYP